MKEKLRSLNNIHFVGCLAILLLNDFYLKAEYPNGLTGKLSDFCGLFVFASFWAALFPTRKGTVCISTALIFVIWKSPYSQTFIDFFSQNLYPIHRIIDVTDLIALPVLLVAFFHNTENSIELRLNPIPIALLTIISFCATSLPHYKQKFSQPQFILFKSGIVDFVNSDRPSRYQVYDLDSFVVISIDEIRIDRQAVIDDDYHKTQILSGLDLRLVRDSQEPYGENDLSGYKTLRDSLTVKGRSAITLKHDSIIDGLNFQNSRLDGNFKRSVNDRLLFEGKFKNGIEDSVWVFYDDDNKVVTRKYFENGELIQTEQFEKPNLISEQKHQTRDDIVRNKYFHLAILGLLVISVLARLILNFRKSEKENIIQLSSFLTVLGMIGLPLVVLTLAKLISSWIPYSYSNIFLGIFIEAFFVYLIAGPLFLLVLAGLKLRSKFDLVLYILLFSLSLVLIEEWIQLKALV
jgi:hypothetical protein